MKTETFTIQTEKHSYEVTIGTRRAHEGRMANPLFVEREGVSYGSQDDALIAWLHNESTLRESAEKRAAEWIAKDESFC